jgi:L-lactate dehydrogenase
MVVGEHGTSEVLLWSTASVADGPAVDLLGRSGRPAEIVLKEIEDDVRYANIAIIEGTGASRYGIASVAARLTAAVLRDERVLLPIGVHHPQYGTTLSLPAIVGANGVERVVEPSMSTIERAALERSADILRAASERCVQALTLVATVQQ